MALAFITPTSWTNDTPFSTYNMNEIANDLLFLYSRLGSSNIQYDNVIINYQLLMTGSKGAVSGSGPLSGILFQPTAYEPITNPMYILANMDLTDQQPRFAIDININNSGTRVAGLKWGPGGTTTPDVWLFRNTSNQLDVFFPNTPGQAGFSIFGSNAQYIILAPFLQANQGSQLIAAGDSLLGFLGAQGGSNQSLVISPANATAGMRVDSYGRVTVYTGNQPDTNQYFSIIDYSGKGMNFFVPKSLGGYNQSLVLSGDAVWAFDVSSYDPTFQPRGLVITPWNAFASTVGGIRMTNTGVTTITNLISPQASFGQGSFAALNVNPGGAPGGITTVPVLLASAILATNVNSFAIAIPANTFSHIVVYWHGRSTTGGTTKNEPVNMIINNDSTHLSYTYMGIYTQTNVTTGVPTQSYGQAVNQSFMQVGTIDTAAVSATFTSSGVIEIMGSALNDRRTVMGKSSCYSTAGGGGGVQLDQWTGMYLTATAAFISTLSFFLNGSDNFKSGAVFSVYGFP